MLNRKLSDYLYDGTLFGILALVVLVRFILMNSINGRIEDVDSSNISLQDEIEALNELVQENKDIQTAHLYELYNIVPNTYSSTSLTYTVVSILEEVGVDESDDMQRNVFINEVPGLDTSSRLDTATRGYDVVQVEVFFTTDDAATVNDFIDRLYASDQLFLIRNLDYTIPQDGNFIAVVVNFLAIYTLDDTEESTAAN
jgi:hypothetical protein